MELTALLVRDEAAVALDKEELFIATSELKMVIVVGVIGVWYVAGGKGLDSLRVSAELGPHLYRTNPNE